MSQIAGKYPCPSCGYYLNEQPWDGESPSDSICPSCGIQFGLDDVPSESGVPRNQSYVVWRTKWMQAGMPWFSASRPAPANWNPAQQLVDAGLADR